VPVDTALQSLLWLRIHHTGPATASVYAGDSRRKEVDETQNTASCTSHGVAQVRNLSQVLSQGTEEVVNIHHQSARDGAGCLRRFGDGCATCGEPQNLPEVESGEAAAWRGEHVEPWRVGVAGSAGPCWRPCSVFSLCVKVLENAKTG
jgi:hypothetical protein